MKKKLLFRMQQKLNIIRSNAKRILLGSVFVIILVAIAVQSYPIIANSITNQMTLEEIKINEVGKSNLSYLLSRSDLIQASGLQYGEKLLTLRLDEISKRLKLIPWIKDVKISLSLPSSINIEYEVHNVRASVLKNNALWMVSSEGVLVAPFSKLALSSQLNEATDRMLDKASVAIPQQSKIKAVVDYPVVVNMSKELPLAMQWIDSLERGLSSKIIMVHEVKRVGPTTIEALVEVAYKGYSIKIVLKTWDEVRATSMARLAQVLDHIINKNIVAYQIDIRPGKKVIVTPLKNT